jgi:hypothetical protein
MRITTYHGDLDLCLTMRQRIHPCGTVFHDAGGRRRYGQVPIAVHTSAVACSVAMVSSVGGNTPGFQ